MVNPRLWNVVHETNSPDVVLAADFPVTGRNEGGFPELVQQWGADVALWQTVPPTVMPDTDITPADYLKPWLSEVADSGRRVRAVLGYCAGSVFAAALAEEIAAWQQPAPEVVVLDPELITVVTAHLQFGRVMGNMAAVLNEDEVKQVEQDAAQLAAREGAGTRAFTADLFTRFRPLAQQAFTRAGLEEEFGEELIELVGSFMTYLSVASQLDPRPGWARGTALSSTSPSSGLNRMRASGEVGEGAVAHELTFDVEHRDLLRTAAVAEALTRILEK
ncbi:hypothetical protein ABT324_17170 [Saccharopolyspora sp. NPDC000359]|uniref:hypothetical protein n=1 Tax=Saccharopolyspora sp. NPDC000359 TaxID=3154251 RepID=UPI00332E69F7